VTYLLGASVVGGRADDIAAATRFLAQRKSQKPIDVVAVGSHTVPTLHAVALDPSSFGKVTLRGGLKSWLDVVRNPLLPGQLINVVHGALLDYDLTDLAASLPQGTVTIEEPLR
jgi:hypothetical protein